MSEHREKPVVDPEVWAAEAVNEAARGLVLPEKPKRTKAGAPSRSVASTSSPGLLVRPSAPRASAANGGRPTTTATGGGIGRSAGPVRRP